MRDTIDCLIARIEESEPELQALVDGTFQAHRVREEIALLAKRFPEPKHRPPLFCLPVGIKDIYRVNGFPTRCGTRLPSALFGGNEAVSVSALKRAGAVVVAKTATTEFAGFAPGATRNPVDRSHTPGGSSSGSAAGVAAGYFPAALGTQTIGSIIRPAAYCGVVGFKPSFGRIPTAGIVPFSPSADHAGVIATNLEMTERILSVLAPEWNPAPPQASPVLCVPDGPYLEQASPRGLEVFEENLARLAEGECQIQRARFFPDIEQINHDHWRLICGEVTRIHQDWRPRHQSLYQPEPLDYFVTGRPVADEELCRLPGKQSALRDTVERFMERDRIAAWICPSATGPAPEGIASTGDASMNLPWTHAGLPAVSLPAGRDEKGLPLGLQIVGRFHRDEELIRVAECVQRSLA